MIHDALIVGSGPAGATAARLLAQAGWSVVLVEKSVFPRRKVCGEFISATSLPLLDAAGIGPQFAARAGPEIRRVALFAGRAAVAAPMPAVRGARAWGRALGREHLDGLLRDAAVRAGARLLQPCKLIDLNRTGDIYNAHVESPQGVQELTARIVIAANGSWERSALSVPPPKHRPSDLLAFKAHFRDSDLAGDLMPLLMFPGGYGGMAPIDDGRASLSCCIRRDRLAQVRHAYPALAAGEAVLAHIRRHCDGVEAALRRARLAGPMLSAGPIRPGIRKMHNAGVFRVGNAAGEAHPIIAEGISMAIQSSWLLCQRLVATQDDLADSMNMNRIGEAYARDWNRRFAVRLGAAAVLARLAMQPGTAALSARLAERAPPLLTWGAQVSGKAMPLPQAG